jgi:hypothetical protein
MPGVVDAQGCRLGAWGYRLNTYGYRASSFDVVVDATGSPAGLDLVRLLCWP